jgi:hypothetical protein
MTDNTPNEPTKAETDKLEKLAEDYKQNGKKVPGYGYRLVPAGNNQSKWVAVKLGKKA